MSAKAIPPFADGNNPQDFLWVIATAVPALQK